MPCNLCGKWNCVCQYSQPKQQQEFTSCFFSREAMKEHSDFHPQPKAKQDKPAIDTTPSQPAIDTTPQPKQEEQEPVALVTGVYGGRFTYAPIKASVVLPVGMALYTHPQPSNPLEQELYEALVGMQNIMYAEAGVRSVGVDKLIAKYEAAHGIKE